MFKTALFASWFSFGLPAIFWLFMNKGQYFSSSRKIALTVVNVMILGIACVLVCPRHPHHLYGFSNVVSIVRYGSLGFRQSHPRQSQQRKFLMREQCLSINNATVIISFRPWSWRRSFLLLGSVIGNCVCRYPDERLG